MTDGTGNWKAGDKPALQPGAQGSTDASRAFTQRRTGSGREHGRELTKDLWRDVAFGQGLGNKGRARVPTRRERRRIEELMIGGDDDSSEGSSSDDEPLWKKKKKLKKEKRKKVKKAGIYGKGFNLGMKKVLKTRTMVFNREKILELVRRLAGKESKNWDLGKVLSKLDTLDIPLPELNYLGMVECVKEDILHALFKAEEEAAKGMPVDLVEIMEVKIRSAMALFMRVLEDGALYKPEAQARLLRTASDARLQEFLSWEVAYDRFWGRVLGEKDLKREGKGEFMGKSGGNNGFNPAGGRAHAQSVVRSGGTCRGWNFENKNCLAQRRGGRCKFYHGCLGCGGKDHTIFECVSFSRRWQDHRQRVKRE